MHYKNEKSRRLLYSCLHWLKYIHYSIEYFHCLQLKNQKIQEEIKATYWKWTHFHTKRKKYVSNSTLGACCGDIILMYYSLHLTFNIWQKHRSKFNTLLKVKDIPNNNLVSLIIQVHITAVSITVTYKFQLK